MVTTDDESQVD